MTVVVAASAVMVAFLAVPILAIFVTASPAGIARGFGSPVAHSAIRLSLVTSTIALVLVVAFGTPLAWVLARGRSRVLRAVEILVQLPIVIPPAVAGIGLILTFGRRGLLGQLTGGGLGLTTTAVVLAEAFVAAPLFIQGAIAGFRSVDEGLLVVARTLGASPLRVFVTIVLPLARGPLVGGLAMCWARALGEFGATLLFAGNLEGRTQTLPLAIYQALESDLAVAQALSIVLLTVAGTLLAFLHFTGRAPSARRKP